MSTTRSTTSVTPTEPDAAPVRTYGQYCPVAVGLDLLGDRWTLLICRELALGDARFTDLKTVLRGIAPNLLTERLRALRSAGLVDVRELPPPAARTVYHLTEEGREVIPVLRSLARFGARHLHGEPSEWFTARRALYALLLPYQRRRPDRSFRARLDFGADDTFDIVLSDDAPTLGEPSGDAAADLVVRTSAAALTAARQGAAFDATFEGGKADAAAFLATFELPREGRLGR